MSTLAVIALISIMAAWGAARFVYRNSPAIFGPERTVWTDVLARSGEVLEGGANQVAFIAARLKDGRIFEGVLFSFPAGPTDEAKELALQAPIYVRDSPSSQRVRIPDSEFLILLLTEITDVSVVYVNAKMANALET